MVAVGIARCLSMNESLLRSQVGPRTTAAAASADGRDLRDRTVQRCHLGAVSQK
jgi:hypothetical protein